MWLLIRCYHPAAVLLGLWLSLISVNAGAHALDFASLTVQQVSQGHWQVIFQQTNNVTQPGKPDNTQGVELQLPPHCDTGYSSHAFNRNNQETRQWQVSCEPPHQPDWLEISGSNKSQVFFHWKTLEGQTAEQLLAAGTTRFVLSNNENTDRKTSDTSPQDNSAVGYLLMGMEHIAIGFDHLAFVLLAVLIAVRFKAIVMVITAFTIGHCLTLMLATLDLITVNQAFVEWLIALSIVFMAMELIRNRNTITRQQPAVVAFIFGLVHGLGFASVLADAGIPWEHRLFSLVFFNLGVEIGQIIFVLLCAPLIYWLGQQTRTWPGKTLAYGVGSVAAYWLAARTLLL